MQLPCQLIPRLLVLGDLAEVRREDEIDMGVLLSQHFLSNKSEPDVDPSQPAEAAAAG